MYCKLKEKKTNLHFTKAATASMEGGKISTCGNILTVAKVGKEWKKRQNFVSILYQKVSLVRELSTESWELSVVDSVESVLLSVVCCRLSYVCLSAVDCQLHLEICTMTHKYSLAHASNDDPGIDVEERLRDSQLWQFATATVCCSFNWILLLLWYQIDI